MGASGITPSGPVESRALREVTASASGEGSPLSFQFCTMMRTGESCVPASPHSRDTGMAHSARRGEQKSGQQAGIDTEGRKT